MVVVEGNESLGVDIVPAHDLERLDVREAPRRDLVLDLFSGDSTT